MRGEGVGGIKGSELSIKSMVTSHWHTSAFGHLRRFERRLVTRTHFKRPCVLECIREKVGTRTELLQRRPVNLTSGPSSPLISLLQLQS